MGWREGGDLGHSQPSLESAPPPPPPPLVTKRTNQRVKLDSSLGLEYKTHLKHLLQLSLSFSIWQILFQHLSLSLTLLSCLQCTLSLSPPFNYQKPSLSLSFFPFICLISKKLPLKFQSHPHSLSYSQALSLSLSISVHFLWEIFRLTTLKGRVSHWL